MGYSYTEGFEMITIGITKILIFYVAITIISFTILMFYKRYPKPSSVSDKIVVRCPVCAFRYIVYYKDKMHKCPQCDSYNITDEKSKHR